MENQIRVGCADYGPKEYAYVNAALKSGNLNNAVYTQRFEKMFAEKHGCKYGLMVNSGTDALRIAIATLKEVHRWKDGDEILVPATTFIASANVVLQNALKVRFVDVERHTYNINSSHLVKHLTRTTRAIVVVHLFGLPANMAGISKFAKTHSLKIIEDSCETMGVKHQGISVGSLSDIACFSTYMAHLITTGVGGLAITNNLTYARIMRSYANHGRDPSFFGGVYGAQKIGDPRIIRNRFKFERIGYSSRCTELEAALGLAQLERLDEIIAKRQQVAAWLIREMYARDLNEFLQLPIQHPDYAENARMMFPIVVKKGSKRKLVEFLEKNGIETRDAMPLLSQPVYRKMFGDLSAYYPNATWISRNGFYIGCHQKMTLDDVAYIVEVISKYFRNQRRN